MVTPTPRANPAWPIASGPARAEGRSLDDFGELSRAEQTLLDSCRRGTFAVIGETLPARGTARNRVRASFVRFLALGGDDQAPVHEHGVQILGAWLTGVLDLDAATVQQELTLIYCRIERIDAFHANLKSLNLNGCRVRKGVVGDRLHCAASVSLALGFHATGEVYLFGATIGGDLNCVGSRFEKGQGSALSLEGATISGNVMLASDFHAVGTVRLLGANIGGALDCSGGRFERADGTAIILDGASVSQGVFFSAGFHATGEVRLLGANLGRNFECIGGVFENPGGDALSCDRFSVPGDVLFRDPFRATGNVRLVGVNIGGNLECDGSSFDSSDAPLSCNSATIAGSVFLRDGFRATGEVDFAGATIGLSLDCRQGSFSTGSAYALSCNGTRVRGEFLFYSLREFNGGIDLSSMHVASLQDDAASWAGAREKITLDGFTYERLAGGAPTDADGRIDWLDAQWPSHLREAFRPQPWEQLIGVLRIMGHPGDARAVAIAKQERLRGARKIVTGARTLHWLYGQLVGYGYRPFRLLFATGAIWLLCAAAYLAAANPGWFGATTYLIAPPAAEPGAGAAPPDYENFVPLIYSADVLLPVVDLGYKDEWQPIVRDRAGNSLFWGKALRFLYWFEIAFGWVAGLLLVGVLGNLIKKD